MPLCKITNGLSRLYRQRWPYHSPFLSLYYASKSNLNLGLLSSTLLHCSDAFVQIFWYNVARQEKWFESVTENRHDLPSLKYVKNKQANKNLCLSN